MCSFPLQLGSARQMDKLKYLVSREFHVYEFWIQVWYYLGVLDQVCGQGREKHEEPMKNFKDVFPSTKKGTLERKNVKKRFHLKKEFWRFVNIIWSFSQKWSGSTSKKSCNIRFRFCVFAQPCPLSFIGSQPGQFGLIYVRQAAPPAQSSQQPRQPMHINA